MPMFKSPGVIRRRVLEVVENRLKVAEEKYDHAKNDLIEKHADELSRVTQRHDVEHEALVDGFVNEIVAKIL